MDSTCTIQRRRKKQKLSYTSGSGTPTIGQTVTGGTSHQTTEIARVGTGYIVVKTVSGSFTIGETLTSLTFSGTLSVIADYQNQSGEYEYYWSDDQTLVPCRFGYSGSDKKGLIIHETGQLLDLPVKIALPDSITLVGTQAEWAENYRIVSTTPGFYGTFQILTPY
ncbi:MAG: hypothetical protein LUQ50_12200, partial [Methanospirillum sp.]|uniref:hypothetical protein n=1 Tax=Methanospirillum sp. TaxID=45200 RepID=UPI00237184D6